MYMYVVIGRFSTSSAATVYVYASFTLSSDVTRQFDVCMYM